MADYSVETFAADQNPIAGNWVPGPGAFDAIKALSGVATAVSRATEAAALYNGALGDDQHCQATIVTGGQDGLSLILRCGSTTNGSCYLALLTNWADPNYRDVEIYKITDSGSLSFAKLGTTIGSLTIAAGSVVKFEATGSSTVTLEVFDDGVSVGSRTDSTSPYTSGYAGMHIYGNAADPTWDDFSCGPTAAGGGGGAPGSIWPTITL